MRSPAPERIVCAYTQAGSGRLAVLDLAARSAAPARYPVHRIRLGAGGRRPRRVSRRRARPPGQHRRRSISAPAGTRVLKKATDILDRADLRLADYLTKVESVEFPTTDGETAFGLFYPPRNPDYAGARRRAAAAAGQVPRRADLGGVEHAQSRHSILDQPRHRRARRELPRQHRLRPRLPRPPAPDLGRGRRRRLRSWRELSRRARAGRRQALRHQRRQRRRLYHAGGARPSATSSRAGRAITA